MKKRILLLEDEDNLQQTLKLNLEMEGCSVVAVSDGRSAIQRFDHEKFDLVILDIMVPLINGVNVCENIRLKDEDVPILFLSAKNTPADRVMGLKSGADDYLIKPFNLEELILRVKKLLNRKDKSPLSIEMKRYDFGDNSIDFECYEAHGVNGHFKLTKKEAQLLKLLIEHRNQVVSREKILQTVWGYNVYPSTRTIDNFILSFRRYFEADPKKPAYFRSLRGVGYRFTHPGGRKS